MQTLSDFPHVTVLPCAEGFLACGATGTGRMLEPEDIFAAADLMMTEQTLARRRVLITAGPTQEKIDPVRFISNYSSGKMGIALAEEAAKRGAEVTLVLGPTALRPHVLPNLRVVDVTSALEMHDAAVRLFPESNIAILCAAVADFRVANPQTEKIKRAGKGSMSLELVENPDIAATLGERKRANQTLVGFALETNDEEENALKKLESKHLDMILLNSLRTTDGLFGSDTNVVTVYTKDGNKIEWPKMTKTDVARNILDLIR